jgi:hypothetical protein
VEVSNIHHRTIVLQTEKSDNFESNQRVAPATTKFPCRLKTAVPFGDFYGLNPGEFYTTHIELTAGTYISVCWTSDRGKHRVNLADGGLIIKD